MLEKWVVLCRDAFTAWRICASYYAYDSAEYELARLRAKNPDLWFTVARESHLKAKQPFLKVES